MVTINQEMTISLFLNCNKNCRQINKQELKCAITVIKKNLANIVEKPVNFEK